MKPGQTAELQRRFTREDLRDYAEISGHSGLGDEIPEPLIGALFSCLLGVHLPGLGTMYLKQETQFLRAAAVGDKLTARVTITRVRPEKHLVDLQTACYDGAGECVADGRALVHVRDVVDRRD